MTHKSMGINNEQFEDIVLSDIRKIAQINKIHNSVYDFIEASNSDNMEIIKYSTPIENGDSFIQCLDILRTILFQDIFELFRNADIKDCFTNVLNYNNLFDAISIVKRRRDDTSTSQYLRLGGKKTLFVSEKNKASALQAINDHKYDAPGSSDSECNLLPKDLELVVFPNECFDYNLDMWFVVEAPKNWNGIKYYLPEKPLYIWKENELVFEYIQEIINYHGIFVSK